MKLNFNIKLKSICLIFTTFLLFQFLPYSIVHSKTTVHDIVSEYDYETIIQIVPNSTKSGMHLYYNNKSCDTKFIKYNQLYVSFYDNFDSRCLLICAEPFINDNWFIGRSHKIWGNYVLALDTELTNSNIEFLEALYKILLSVGAKEIDKKLIKTKGNFNFAIGRCKSLKESL